MSRMMNIEIRHLRMIEAIHGTGGLAEAARQLHLSQSALSHQIRAIREQLGVDPFLKNTRPMRLSAEGMRLLRAANRILPEIEALKSEFSHLRAGQAGRLHIAIECHACFEWLFPLLTLFRNAYPEVDVDIRPGLAFRGLEALGEQEVDIVISSDPEDRPELIFERLFDYAPTFICARNHRLAERPFITAEDFANETLVTYPVERKRLDIFSQFLTPAGQEPRAVRQIELTDVILLLVGSGKGISVLPDWVLETAGRSDQLLAKPLGPTGLTRQLYAAVRQSDADKPYIRHFLELGKQARQPQSGHSAAV